MGTVHRFHHKFIIIFFFWLLIFATFANFTIFCFGSHYSLLQNQNLIPLSVHWSVKLVPVTFVKRNNASFVMLH